LTEADFLAAAASGDLDLVERYIAAGGCPETRDPDGRTALMLCALYGHRTVFRKLLSEGAEVDAVDARGVPCAEYVRYFGRLSEASRRLRRVLYLRALMKHVGRVQIEP
jgi:ankyrin repeat protein